MSSSCCEVRRQTYIVRLLCVLFLHRDNHPTVQRLAHHIISIDDAYDKMAQRPPRQPRYPGWRNDPTAGPISVVLDDAPIAFNNFMAMETFSLVDDERRSSMPPNFGLYKKYNTRLVRTDPGMRTRIDPF
ncbi:hypothetical protein F4680DRAFT_402474 [Xylaria scruposa]|nr:hypothetical protein F4680DRAFT_402474 [Xylaria scruposa]